MKSDDLNFKGITHLYGQKSFQTLQNSHVGIAGLGGVGSWVAEALVRSGIGQLTLIDMDEVCVSNINRQVQALYSTVGLPKVEALKNRCLDINPNLKIVDIFDFVTKDNLSEIFKNHFDYFIDATDSVQIKCEMANVCKQKNIPFLMIGAAGGKSNPHLIQIRDLNKIANDPLLRQVKLALKKDYGFTSSLKSLKIPTVFSTETIRYPDGDGGICETAPQDGVEKLDCAKGLGSVVFVTATFGFLAAHHVIEDLIA